jgi:hypothetical protein
MSRFMFLICSVIAAVSLSSTRIEYFAQTTASRAEPSSVEWSGVSSFDFDWDGRGTTTVIVEKPSDWDGAEHFARIRIRVPGRKDFVLANKGAWVKYGSDDAELSPDLRKANLISSDYVLAMKASENRTLLFLLGYSYGSSPGSLDALEISKDGQPGVVLHRDEFGLKELRDLDGDGIAEVVGYACLSQEWGKDVLTYDPFNVYKLGISPGVPANLSLPLSESYNLKYYYGWAGAECREDIVVVLHPPSGDKPVVVTAEEALRTLKNKPKP